MSNIYLVQLIQSKKHQYVDGAGIILTASFPVRREDSNTEFEGEESMKVEDAIPVKVTEELDILFNPKHDRIDDNS